MSRIKKQLEICPPAYMCKGPNRENFVSTGHKCGYCKGNGWFWGTDKANKNVYMLLSVGLMQAYTRKADINTIPFGENLNMN